MRRTQREAEPFCQIVRLCNCCQGIVAQVLGQGVNKYHNINKFFIHASTIAFTKLLFSADIESFMVETDIITQTESLVFSLCDHESILEATPGGWEGCRGSWKAATYVRIT